MQVSQIQTLLSSWLDDPNQSYFLPAQTLVWINNAQRQVQLQLIQAGQNFYEKPVETTLVINQSDYMLPSDFIELHRLEVVISGTAPNENRSPITEVTTNQQDLVALSTGTPVHYLIKKDRFTLFPCPDQALTLRLYYSPMVTDLANSTDVPDVPEEYMEYVCLLAAFNGFIKDDRAPQNLMAKKAEYETLLKQMAVDRTTDRSRQVVEVGGYGIGDWVY